MKTIEERAFDYATNNPFGHPYNWNAHYDGYKDGAIEQKLIDTKKVCNYCCSLCIDDTREECLGSEYCDTIKNLIDILEN